VQRIVPPERLLVFEPKMGWNAVCLPGCAGARNAYPRTNSTDEVQEFMQTLIED